MVTGVLGELVALTSLVATPVLSPLQIDPGAVTESSRPLRAVVSFLVVVLVGGFLHVRLDGLLDRAVDDVMDRPRIAVVYGVLAYGTLAFCGLYLNNVLVQAGLLDSPLAFVALSLVLVGVLVLSSFGFLVVGTVVTDLRSGQRSWQGPLLGGALSTVPWLLLPFTAGVIVWLVLAAFGLGGRTRTWVHASQAVETE